MIPTAEFPAIPGSAAKIASERRCAILVHSAWLQTDLTQSRFLGRGCDEAVFSEKRGFFSSRAAKRGGVSNGGVSRSGLVLPFLSFFVLFGTFPIFLGFSRLICSGMVRGFSRFVFFLLLSLLRAPTRNSPERVRDTIWTFPEKKWESPRFGNPPV